jgi:hypothetical protein
MREVAREALSVVLAVRSQQFAPATAPSSMIARNPNPQLRSDGPNVEVHGKRKGHSRCSTALRRVSPGVLMPSLYGALPSGAVRRGLRPPRRGKKGCERPGSSTGLRLVTRRPLRGAPSICRRAQRLCAAMDRRRVLPKPKGLRSGKEQRPQGGDWARSPTEEVPSSYCQNPTALCLLVYADSRSSAWSYDTSKPSLHVHAQLEHTGLDRVGLGAP